MGRHLVQLLKIDIENGGTHTLPYARAFLLDDLESKLTKDFDKGCKAFIKFLKQFHPLEQLFMIRDLSHDLFRDSPFDYLRPRLIQYLSPLDDALINSLQSHGLDVVQVKKQLAKFNWAFYEKHDLDKNSNTIVWLKSERELAKLILSLFDNGSIPTRGNRAHIYRVFSEIFILSSGTHPNPGNLEDHITQL